MAPLQVAREVMPVKRRATRAMEMGCIVYYACFHSGRGHDRFESRTRSELRLDSTIEQRLVWIIHHRAPLCPADSPRKLVWIIRWAADQGEHFSVARIERDDGTPFVRHGELRYGLQIQIDGQP